MFNYTYVKMKKCERRKMFKLDKKDGQIRFTLNSYERMRMYAAITIKRNSFSSI